MAGACARSAIFMPGGRSGRMLDVFMWVGSDRFKLQGLVWFGVCQPSQVQLLRPQCFVSVPVEHFNNGSLTYCCKTVKP